MYASYGCMLLKGAYKEILSPPSIKKRAEYNYLDKSGLDVDTSSPIYYEAKRMSLPIVIVANDTSDFWMKNDDFLFAIKKPEGFQMEITELGITLNLLYEGLVAGELVKQNGVFLARYQLNVLEKDPASRIYKREPLVLKYKQTDYPWNRDTHARSACLVNNSMAVIDKQLHAIHYVSLANGLLKSSYLNDSVVGFSITADKVGNIFASAMAGGTSKLRGTLIVNGVNGFYDVDIVNIGQVRIDYLAAYGDFSKTGILAGAALFENIIAIWMVEGGVILDPQAPLVIEGVRNNVAAAATDLYWIDENKIIISGQNAWADIIKINWGSPENSMCYSLPSASLPGAGGGCGFFVKEQMYIALASDRFGSIAIYKIDSFYYATKVANVISDWDAPNAAVHLSIQAEVKDNYVDIFVWVPNNGMAVYRFNP